MDKGLPASAWPEWKITEKIGEGSFGKVYKAERTERGKTFYSAIKVISIPGSQGELKSVRSESGSDQSTREYFKNLMEECIQEVSTMEYFRGNSHIVAVEDYKVVEYLDAIGWDIFIRMEYLTSFLEYCSGKQLEEEEVIQLGIDLCKALQFCQMLNIIHRDIKPENIFVSRFGEFKLGDFGIARELEKSMGSFSKKGTYSYMAPEMYRGEAYDSRVDIYSLAIMLYKLRNKNRLPFLSLEKQLITYRDKENALNRRMAGDPLPKPAQASGEFARIILKACAFDREERYSSAEEFRRDLEDLQYGRRIAAAGWRPPVEAENRGGSQRQPAGTESRSGTQRQPVGTENRSGSQRPSAGPENRGGTQRPPAGTENRSGSQRPSAGTENRGGNQRPLVETENRSGSQRPSAGPENRGGPQRPPAGTESRGGNQRTSVKPEERPTSRRTQEKTENRQQSVQKTSRKSEEWTNGQKISARSEERNGNQKSPGKTGAETSRRRAEEQKRRRKKALDTKLLVGMIVVMAVAAIMVFGVFFRLLWKVGGRSQENGYGFSDENLDESEDAELSAYLGQIRLHATDIENNLNNYNWIGSETEGRITYLDQKGQIMKILIYPTVSQDGYYEEYYYWDGDLFFVYVWEDTGQDINYYYYRQSELVRWIDNKNVCHDYEWDNEEYVELQERYLTYSELYTAGLTVTDE